MMNDITGKEIKLGDYIVYFVKGSTEVKVRLAVVIGYMLNNSGDITLKVRAVTKRWNGTYLKLHTMVTLTKNANIIVTDTLPSEALQKL